ncbi:SDR family oxidoreductase [Streptomyces resistomycificus]|uniref:Nucleoside-diphosphate sugar epimerase n=1 Tax=Streptomyces resistomycificus TaxID=67356 RepID=A0A0L8KPJ5_9ACTN|nr:SDR family oxidoreductase [Streptomyces resistomycificus]KOG27886.1 nucleoside-diphosphate sugar epimerase [Streptomyces resistomycificus]KUO02281.1 NAD(P)-dependent oxidoreductase [Streptomyces resistomycificus]
MILVTGATGTVGGLVADRLSGAGPVRLLTRDPRRVTRVGPGAEVVGGDFDDLTGLRAALTGVRSALLVTSNPLAPAHDENFVTAARAAGVRHVVKLSAQAVTDPGATDLITRWQRDNEALLRASGLAWTLLRPRAFMSNTLGWGRSVRAEGVVRAPDGTSRNASVDPRDIADVAVRVLRGPAEHAGRAYALTGPAALTAVQQTSVLGELLGRPLRFEELTEDQAWSGLSARYPEPVARALMESAGRGRLGAKARVDSTVTELLGRPARSYRDWAGDHLAAFGG